MAGIYIHIPFCKTRCIYCDFYSTTHGNLHHDYIEAVSKELTIRKNELSSQKTAIETIYIGGGTPSTLLPSYIGNLLDVIRKEYTVSEHAEITMEANPDDLDLSNVKALRNLSINRLSIGIQSFHDDKLLMLNRRHNGQEAIDAVKRCQDAGFDNLNIDLIYGLPDETLEEWDSDLQQAIGLNTQHISAYALIYEENTPLWKAKMAGKLHEVTDDLSNDMFTSLMKHTATAGFEHYEISNFARPGFRSRHNSSYWKDIPYIGCGASAHSYNGTQRKWNCSDINLYIKGIAACHTQEELEQASWIEKEHLTLKERYNECIITSLRTVEGLSLDLLKEKFGDNLTNYCLKNANRHIRNGYLELTKNTKHSCLGVLRITHQGIFVSDGVMSDLLAVAD